MLDYFLVLFEQTCVSLVPFIPAVVAIWLLFDLISGLLFKER